MCHGPWHICCNCHEHILKSQAISITIAGQQACKSQMQTTLIFEYMAYTVTGKNV